MDIIGAKNLGTELIINKKKIIIPLKCGLSPRSDLSFPLYLFLAFIEDEKDILTQPKLDQNQYLNLTQHDALIQELKLLLLKQEKAKKDYFLGLTNDPSISIEPIEQIFFEEFDKNGPINCHISMAIKVLLTAWSEYILNKKRNSSTGFILLNEECTLKCSNDNNHIHILKKQKKLIKTMFFNKDFSNLDNGIIKFTDQKFNQKEFQFCSQCNDHTMSLVKNYRLSTEDKGGMIIRLKYNEDIDSIERANFFIKLLSDLTFQDSIPKKGMLFRLKGLIFKTHNFDINKKKNSLYELYIKEDDNKDAWTGYNNTQNQPTIYTAYDIILTIIERNLWPSILLFKKIDPSSTNYYTIDNIANLKNDLRTWIESPLNIPIKTIHNHHKSCCLICDFLKYQSEAAQYSANIGIDQSIDNTTSIDMDLPQYKLDQYSILIKDMDE